MNKFGRMSPFEPLSAKSRMKELAFSSSRTATKNSSRRLSMAVQLLLLAVAVVAVALFLPSPVPAVEAFSPPSSSRAAATICWSGAGGAISRTTAAYFPKAARCSAAASAVSLSSTSADAAASTDEGDGNEGATILQETANLVKAIVGAGVLTLPAGIAAFGNAPSALIPAVALIAGIGSLSAYGFGLIGRVCAMTDAPSVREAWSETVGQKTAWIPSWTVVLKTCFASLAYSMILADTAVSLLTTATGMKLSKAVVLPALTTTVLLPLCLLKNLKSLAPFSLLGSLGMLYTAAAMVFRFCGGLYKSPGGAFLQDLAPHLRPSFGTTRGAMAVWSPSTAILVGMLSTSYMAHFNAPKFYFELQNRSVPRYLRVVGLSFGLSVLLFSVMAAAGFGTFGAASSGVILNNYSTRDSLMAMSRVAVFFSLLFAYPLTYVGARDGILDCFCVEPSKRTSKLLTVFCGAFLTVVTSLALVIPDVSFVLAFAGATLGNALIYVYPALMFRGAVRKKKSGSSKSQQREVKVALASAILGVIMGAMGATKAVQSVL